MLPRLVTSDRFSRVQRLLAGGALLLLLLAVAFWTQRWAMSRRAVEIVGPAVRAWATKEVRRLSDDVYHLSLSPLRVDEDRRRLSIDTIILVTDTVANGQRGTPLPTVMLRFLGCAMEGIDLDRLAAQRGLHVSRAGCDSVQLVGEVPAPTTGVTDPGAASTFLGLRENLDLPRAVPFIRIDTVAFPQLALELGITSRNQRRMSLAFDHLAVRMDSLHYDPRQPPEERPPLLARDVTLRVERFAGTQAASNHLTFDSLSASLTRGNIQLDGLRYAPLPGVLSDSLNFRLLEVGHLGVVGMDWERFLTSGDLSVQQLTVQRTALRFPPPASGTEPTSPTAPSPQRSIGMVLRAIGREIRLDTLVVEQATVTEEGMAPRDSIQTSLERLVVTGVRFDEAASWITDEPIGPVTIAASGFARWRRDERLAIGHLHLSVPDQVASIDSFSFGPQGSDAAFRSQHRYREDRIVLQAAGITVEGVDLTAYLRRGSLIARRADARGVDLDLLTDKRMPVAPGRRTRNRIPQHIVRDLARVVRLDSLRIAGEARYRERAPESPAAGVVTFRDLRADLTAFSTATDGDVTPVPLRLVADARLMGAGAFHLELEIPVASEHFDMTYQGRLGPMPAAGLNAFAANGAGLRFTSGEIEAIQFSATVRGGRARGSIAPRWHDLGVEFPGMSRDKTGIFGSLKRAAAKLVANAFLVRDDNTARKGDAPRDGIIDHRWTPSQSLPQFLWQSLRDPLISLMRK